MQRVINLYGGPGTGKSTTAAGLFHHLKLRGVNCEYVQEYAKDKAWELSSTPNAKVLQAQEYIFAKQHYRMRRVSGEVDLIITDSPVLLSLIYMKDDFPLPSLRNVVKEAYNMYNNLDIFLVRQKAYNPKGRFQTETEAKGLDTKIFSMLTENKIGYNTVVNDENVIESCMKLIDDFMM